MQARFVAAIAGVGLMAGLGFAGVGCSKPADDHAGNGAEHSATAGGSQDGNVAGENLAGDGASKFTALTPDEALMKQVAAQREKRWGDWLHWCSPQSHEIPLKTALGIAWWYPDTFEDKTAVAPAVARVRDICTRHGVRAPGELPVGPNPPADAVEVNAALTQWIAAASVESRSRLFADVMSFIDGFGYEDWLFEGPVYYDVKTVRREGERAEIDVDYLLGESRRRLDTFVAFAVRHEGQWRIVAQPHK